MRDIIETWVIENKLLKFKKITGFAEQLRIDYINKEISLNGIVIVDKREPLIEELEGLKFEEEEDNADILLTKWIESSYRYNCSKHINIGINSKDEKEPFRIYPYKYYEKNSMHKFTPWITRKLLFDIYVYSKLASNKIWTGWSHSNINRDKYLIHKPQDFKPFSTVLPKSYIWEE